MKFILSLSIVSLFVFSANAFTLNSTSNSGLQGWNNGEVQIFVNPTSCPSSIDVVSIVIEAVKVWNNVPTSSVRVSYGGITNSTGISSPPVVYCVTSFAAFPGADPNSVPGAARASAPNGQIVAGDIFLNATSGNANIANFSTNINTITMAHEIGHLLGLGHSHSVNALMYYDGSYRTKLTLSQDDIDGMSYLYPSDEFKNTKTLAGCGTIAVSSLPPPPSGKIMMLLFCILCLPLMVFAKLKSKPQTT
jgi:Matrixin